MSSVSGCSFRLVLVALLRQHACQELHFISSWHTLATIISPAGLYSLSPDVTVDFPVSNSCFVAFQVMVGGPYYLEIKGFLILLAILHF